MNYNFPSLLALKIANIDKIVPTYGLKAVEAFRDELLLTTTDPLAPLWTPDNWPCWLVPEDYVVFLAKRLQVLVYGSRAIGADPDMYMLGSIIHCVPFKKVIDDAREHTEREFSCAWKGCRFSCVESAVERGVKLMGCKGCGMAKYCGRVCQRRDWQRGGHKARCGNRLTRSDSETSTESAASS